jgi:hypothetical protein
VTTTRLRRAGAALLAAILLGGTLTACSRYSEADEVLLFYKSGPGEVTKFQECIAPSAKGPWQFNNRYIALPASQRSWNIQPKGGDSQDPIIASSKPTDGAALAPAVNVWLSMEFYLNTTCTDANSPLVQFWEKTGRKAMLSDNDGNFDAGKWNAMLQDKLVPSLKKAIGEAARKFGADQMDANQQPLGPDGKPLPGSATTWALIEAEVAASLSAQMREKIQGEYFCGPEFNGGKDAAYNELAIDPARQVVAPAPKTATCPPLRISITNIDYNDQRLVDARIQALAVEQQNIANEKAAESKKRVADILAQIGNDPNYIELQRLDAAKYIAEQNRIAAEKCQSSGAQCTVIIGSDGAVNVNTR